MKVTMDTKQPIKQNKGDHLLLPPSISFTYIGLQKYTQQLKVQSFHTEA